MKMYKFSVYVYDFEGHNNPEDVMTLIEQYKYLTSKVFHDGTADIGEWSDDHELNRSGSSQLTFEKYFLESSNGRTPASEAVNVGSSPASRANQKD